MTLSLVESIRPRICIPVFVDRVDKAVEMVKKADEAEPDLIEVRFDRLRAMEGLDSVRAATDKALIATCRPKNHGGVFNGKEDDRLSALIEASALGFDIVDLELDTAQLRERMEEVKENGSDVIVSFHNLEKTPSPTEMGRILTEAKALGADMCKIVGTVKTFDDNFAYLNFLRENSRNSKIICFGMGRLGVMSRVLAPLYGAEFTYASLETGMESAVGQMSITRLRSIYTDWGVI